MGHSWGALDEYHPDAGNSPTVMIGYTQEPDANSMCCTPAHVAANPALAPKATGFFDGAGEGINALMAYNIDYISPWTRGAWGTWDLDGDGINETQDTFPVVTLNAPSGTTTLVFTGNATASTLIRETGAFADANISVNKIVSVEWRMNGGPWQNATAADGTFDESIEDYTFTTPLLRNGPYVFEARARDNFGNASTFYPRRLATASGSAASNNVPMAALSVTPTLGSTATAFQLSAAGSVDAEDSTSLQYRWDFENDSVFDTGFSSSPTITHSYATPGTKTAKVEVRDSAGVPLTTTRLVTFTVQAPNVVPTATFTVDKGALFSATPAVFNFDASGVVDGEDATAALQVRWDFEDDGVFDTTFSTTKTVSHDYAQDFLMNVAFEPALETSLYCCQTPPNVVTGYAQGFVAATSGIGKAAIKIGHYGDTTPGGTCEVGIKSSLAGAFLTSVIKNQTSIVDFDWNTFDFPDISVTIGGSYFIVMLCSDWDIMWQSRRNTEPDYPDGVHWYYLSSSATWFSNASFDHVFRIYDSALTTVPLTKSKSWRVRIEVRDSALQTAQTVRDIWTNAYDTPPTVSLASDAMTGTTATTFNLTATGSDVDSATTWDGLLHYRWDTNGDGNYETEFAATNTRAQSFPQPGIYQATVEVRDRYHATARSTVPLTVEAAGQASKILYSVGDGQSAAINTAVAIDPTVVVRDASSAIVTGAVVVFTVVTGGGTLTEATQTTDGFGIATLGAWTLGGVPGANSIKATLPAFPGPSVTFNATGTAPPPVVTTLAATSIGVTGATLNASINPNGSATMAVFDYGTTTGYGSTTSGTGLGSGSSPVPHSAAISGLTCATEYHFRARASNGGGSTNGSDLAFTTAACPARVFVSVVGVDTNDCSDIATPCRTLNAAIGQVAVDGEVIVIKSGSYAGASITKGVKIDAASGVVAFSGQAVTVNAPGAKVVVRGLTLKAITPGTGTGLLIQNAAAVFVENTVIDGWGFGIQHAVAEVFIKDSTFRSNDTGIWAMGGNTTIDTSRFTNNSIGLATDIGVVSLRGATVSGNNIGIHADASAVVTVEKCQIANNSTGVRVTNDPSVTLRLSRSVVTGNFVGLENLGGTLYVYGNNAIRGNTTNTSGTITTTGLQ
jgi:hypothetical protein